MKSADYKCPNCGTTRTIHVEYGTNFPLVIPCFQCHEDCRRVYTPAFPIVHQGKLGNSKNGYKSNLGPVKKS